jgi:GNAT superfamily N-acetyltransferase
VAEPARDAVPEARSGGAGEPGEIGIDLARPEDVEPLLALLRSCIQHLRAQGLDQWDELYPDQATVESDVRSGAALVARQGSRILGVVVLDEHQDPEYADVSWQLSEGPVVVIHRLMVAPASEGRGLARNLMQAAEERASALGYRSVRLDAFTKNPRALSLYPRLGYRDAGGIQLRKGAFRCFEKPLRAER